MIIVVSFHRDMPVFARGHGRPVVGTYLSSEPPLCPSQATS